MCDIANIENANHEVAAVLEALRNTCSRERASGSYRSDELRERLLAAHAEAARLEALDAQLIVVVPSQDGDAAVSQKVHDTARLDEAQAVVARLQELFDHHSSDTEIVLERCLRWIEQTREPIELAHHPMPKLEEDMSETDQVVSIRLCLDWLDKEIQKIEELDAKGEDDFAGSLSRADRAARLADIAVEYLNLERDEELLVRAAAAKGEVIPRCGCADPRAVLGVIGEPLRD